MKETSSTSRGNAPDASDEYLIQRLREKIKVITGRRGRARPGFGADVRAIRTLDGDTVYRNIPEWCSYSGRDVLNNYDPDRSIGGGTPLSCDCIMKESATDPSSRGCRYTDCVNRGCDRCGGAYKNVGGYMELRSRFRAAARFYSGKAPATGGDRRIWPRWVEPFLFDGWRISKNLTEDD